MRVLGRGLSWSLHHSSAQNRIFLHLGDMHLQLTAGEAVQLINQMADQVEQLEQSRSTP